MSGNSDPSTPRDKIDGKSKGTSPCSNGSNGGWTPGPVSPSPPGAEWLPEKEKPHRKLSFEPTLWRPAQDHEDSLPTLEPIDTEEPFLVEDPAYCLAGKVEAIINQEQLERLRIESCVMPKRSLMHSLVVTHHANPGTLKALLPPVWNHDNTRLALALHVAKGDFAMVEWLLEVTPFRDFSRLRVQSTVPGVLGVDASMLQEHGVTVPPYCDTMLALALQCCKEAMERDHASIRARTEILKLFLQSRYTCFAPADERALLAVMQHPMYRNFTHLSDMLDYWKPNLYSQSSCLQSACSVMDSADAPLYAHLAQLTVRWKPTSHALYSLPFRRLVPIVIRKLLQYRCMSLSLLAHVVQSLQWDPSPMVAAPYKVRTVVLGVPYEGSSGCIKKFDKRLSCGVTVSTTAVRSCVVVGCKEDEGNSVLYAVAAGNIIPLGTLGTSVDITSITNTHTVCHHNWWCQTCQRLVPGRWCWRCNTREAGPTPPSDPPPLVALTPLSGYESLPHIPPEHTTPELPSLLPSSGSGLTDCVPDTCAAIGVWTSSGHAPIVGVSSVQGPISTLHH